jgi:hypothetical protein
MRRNGVFWGILIVLVGIVLLLQNLGFIPARVNVWAILWPAVLILLGLWFLLAPTVFKRDLKVSTASEPLGSAARAVVKVQYGAGKLRLVPLGTPGQLFSGSFAGGVRVERQDQPGGVVKLKLSPDIDWSMMPGTSHKQGLTWDLGLTAEIPMELEIEMGACEADLDLSGLRLSKLSVSTDASSTRLTLPQNAGFTSAKVEGGMASVIITVPQGVGLRAKYSGGLASLKVGPRFVRSGDTCENAEYATAANKIELEAEVGMGSIELM